MLFFKEKETFVVKSNARVFKDNMWGGTKLLDLHAIVWKKMGMRAITVEDAVEVVDRLH